MMNVYKTIENRKVIWNALSEFYLDTELQESDYNRIAEILVASELDIHELKAIDLYEVFPVLKGNILSVAGEWNGFDEKWLIENCNRSFERKKRSIFRIKVRIYNGFLGGMRKSHWDEIEKRM